MGASSHTIRVARCRRRANCELREIAQVEFSSGFIGILSRECAVRPPSRSKAAIPEDATAKAISPCFRTHARITEYKKVFPEPPGPSTKKHLLHLLIIASL